MYVDVYEYLFQIRAIKNDAHVLTIQSMNAYASRMETHPITKSELSEYHFTSTKKSYLHSTPDNRKNSSSQKRVSLYDSVRTFDNIERIIKSKG